VNITKDSGNIKKEGEVPQFFFTQEPVLFKSLLICLQKYMD